MGDAMKWRKFLVCGVCLLALVACDSKKPETTTANEQAAPGAAPGAAMPGTPPESVREQPAANSVGRIQGKAKEVLKGGGFTYVFIAGQKGDVWVAVPETKVSVGEDCAINEGQVMQNFSSKTLNRTFKEIVFATGLEGKKAEHENAPHGGNVAAAPAAAGDIALDANMQKKGAGSSPPPSSPHAAVNEMTPGSGKAVVPLLDLKIAKASGENGFTVADIFAKAASLNGKKVKIKGQVVKVSPNIMGKNWLHLQDGTGDPAKNSHDLVVTSADKAEKGDIVTVEGVLAADKDFGAGYKYAVIVEDVTITH